MFLFSYCAVSFNRYEFNFSFILLELLFLWSSKDEDKTCLFDLYLLYFNR